MKATRILVFLFILTISSALIQSCAMNPVTGKSELMFISPSQEEQIGAQNDPQIVQAFGLYPNNDLQAMVKKYGQEMAAISHRPNIGYEFKVLDSPVINAFAVPGGYVYFTRGIMAHFNNKAEFMGVLGHEIGHVTARHSAQQMTSQYLMTGGLLIGAIAFEDFDQWGETAMMGIQLLGLSFSRSHESQSDKLGVEYSTKIGYDATQMANFFKTIDKLQNQNSQGPVPTFLSTHPDPGDRLERVRKLAIEEQQKYPGKQFAVEREEYLRMIDGITYGEDPRQGYVADGYFFHPEMKFQFPVPSGWRVNNMPTQVQMAPQNDGNVVMMLALGDGSTLQEAAQNFLYMSELEPTRTESSQTNGFSSMKVWSERPDPNNPQGGKVLSVYSTFIQDNQQQLIYGIHGMTYQDQLSRYMPVFQSTMNNFRRLTDPRRTDVKPERIRIKTVVQAGTLAEVLSYFGMSRDRFEELSLLNGMELTDRVAQGSLIKIISTTEQ